MKGIGNSMSTSLFDSALRTAVQIAPANITFSCIAIAAFVHRIEFTFTPSDVK